MTTRTIDCAECGASVAYGRLSCPECGALLASVAGAVTARPRTGEAPIPAPAPALVDPEPAPAMIIATAAPVDIAATSTAAPTPIPSVLRPPTTVMRGPGPAAAPASAGVPVWPADRATIVDDRPTLSAGTRAKDDTLDRARVAEVGGWFILVGAALAALGFLLPWSSVVIGAGSFGGYLSTWGLAGPTHFIVFIGILALLAVAIMRSERIPTWLVFGAVAPGLGGLLLGLAWPYIVGPLGAQLGVLSVALGGLALMAGGGLTVWSTRHLDEGSTV